ncbi:MAG: class I SAM-dependent methyltransferase [Ignavibacteriaceae bacterium]|jgi:SAM-dependent methyltransferase|nr:class I SAM-dependent methyltransferase [Ignavibacteriaceae bacterium]
MAEKHFLEQIKYTKEFIIPYLKEHISPLKNMNVLEIGCAEAGLLFVFDELECKTTGIEISPHRAQFAIDNNKNSKIIEGDITSEEIVPRINDKYDLIIMREVIEHLHKKENALANISKLLKKDGYLFISFPPRYSPFAGHQQIGRTKLSKIPYLHLLPVRILNLLMKKMNEREDFVDEIKLNYSTGMSIAKFEKIISPFGYKIIQKDLYLFRPIYAQRYGLRIVKVPRIPIIREAISFGYEILFKKS